MTGFLRWLGTSFHCADRLYCVSRLSVDLSMWFAGSEKVTRSDELAEAAILLVLTRFDRVRWAIGCMIDGGLGAAITLGGAASTRGAGTLATITLVSGAECTGWLGVVVCGVVLGALSKIARRLSTARSCALQLSCVLSALTAMVSARRQWMILSVVVSVGTDRVGCWKTTVSEIITAEVAILMTLWHL